MRGAATVTSPSELVVSAEGRLLAQQIEAEPAVRALALLTGRLRLHYGSGMLLLERRGQDLHDKEYESNNSFARFSLHLGRFDVCTAAAKKRRVLEQDTACGQKERDMN
ncbi:hypothetical protein MY4038_002169 [Beauveria bassiana]